jgi:hypothetical protein
MITMHAMVLRAALQEHAMQELLLLRHAIALMIIATD